MSPLPGKRGDVWTCRFICFGKSRPKLETLRENSEPSQEKVKFCISLPGHPALMRACACGCSAAPKSTKSDTSVLDARNSARDSLQQVHDMRQPDEGHNNWTNHLFPKPWLSYATSVSNETSRDQWLMPAVEQLGSRKESPDSCEPLSVTKI